MKREPTKFENIPLVVPSLKIVTRKIDKLIEEIKECGSMNTALPVIKKFVKLQDELNTELTVIGIRYSLETDNPVYQKANDRVDEMSPIIQGKVNEFNKILAKARYRKDLEEKMGKYYFTMIDNSLKVFDEKIVPDLVEENKLSSQYDRILGGAKIEFRGNTYNLSQMGKFTTDKDDQTRHDASVKVSEWIGEHNDEIGEIYSKLVTLRDGMAKKLGFKNFTEMGYLRLGRCDYKAKEVKGYREQIAKEVVPLCQKLYKRQAKRLGKPFNKMASYDFNLTFKSGNPKPAGGEKYLLDTASKMYNDMSPETRDFFQMMRKYNLLDLTARAGKAPGGYMTYLPDYKFPFIFANFNGTEGDVNVLTHEVGHAFQGYMSSSIKIPQYRSPTLEACEIHSMSMEFFALDYMDEFFKKDADKYIYFQIESAIEFLPYGISIDEFQHWVYEHPTATHEERCAKFREIEKAYTPHKVYTDCLQFEKGGYWMRQSHIFGAPFYYIDYTLAQVVAFQFYAEMLKNREKAWKKYVKLCKMGGRYPFVTLLEKAKLRNPFVEGNVKKAIRPCAKKLDSIDDSKF